MKKNCRSHLNKKQNKMADSTLAGGAPVGLPSAMQIGKRATVAPAGRLLNASIAPSNGQTFSPSQTIQFDLNLRRGQYYSPSMLAMKFSFAVWQSAAGQVTDVTLDNYATCLFQSLQTYVNSINVESITRYNDLCATFLDLQMTTSQKAGLSVCFGSSTTGDRTGYAIGAIPASAVNSSAAKVYTFVIPVPSAFGAFASSYIDGSDISNIRFNFGLAELGELPCTITANNSVSWEIRQPELLVNIVELANPGIVDQFKAGPVHYHMRSVKTSSQSIPPLTAGELTIPINVRGLSSAVAAFSRFRYASASGNVAGGDNIYRSASTCPNAAQIYYQFGGQNYPQKPVNVMATTEQGMGHSFSRAVMALNMWNSPLAGVAAGMHQQVNTVAGTLNPLIAVAELNTASTSTAAFVYGESLEMFHENDGGILDGVSTESMPGFLRLNLVGTAGGTNNLTLACDTYVLHDLVLVAQSGTVQLMQ